MATLVHAGAADGLLETAARLERVEGDGEVVLVVPEGAPVLGNPLYLQTLRDLGNGRPLVLVTADLRGRALASGARIPAYASVGAFEQRSVDATEQLEKRRIEAIAQIGRERRRRRALRRRTVAAVALAGLLLLAFVPSADVTVSGEEAVIGPVELDVAAGASGPILATPLLARLDVSITGASTGSRPEKVKATGTARLSNVSTDAVDIPAGTLVWTAANVTFRTTQGKTIPASTFYPFLVNSAQLPIEAVEPGTAGNVARGEIRYVANRRLRVSNDEPIAGGDEKQIPQVAAADYTAASVRLDQSIDAAVRGRLESWRATLPPDKRLDDHVSTRALSRTTSAEVVGKETDTFKLAASVEVTAFTVPYDEPRSSVVRELTPTLPAGHELVPESVTVEVSSVRFTSDGLIWHVRANAKHRPRLDEGALQLALAGQDRSVAADLLRERGMKLMEVRASPSWWPRLPLLPLRIAVRDAKGS